MAGLSDALDGFLARILHQQTVLGAYLDPIADKALLASSFITLSVLHIIPGWLTVIVISRDFIILLGISVLSIMSIPVKIRPTVRQQGHNGPAADYGPDRPFRPDVFPVISMKSGCWPSTG